MPASTASEPAGSPLRERLREVREELIVEAAFDLLLEVGYADMTMDHVATRTGMSKATLYQFFPSKQELAMAVVVRNMTRNLAVLDSFGPEVGPVERMERGLRQCLHNRSRFDSDHMGIPHSMIYQHPSIQRCKADLHARVGSLVEAAKAAGEIVPEVTPTIAMALCEALFHANFEEIAARDGIPVDDVVDGMVSILFRGLKGGTQ